MGSIIKMFKSSLITFSLLLATTAVISANDANVPLLQTAMDVLARATSSSQVLSFNLTGVIILIVLKIAVIAYTMLQGGVTGRSGLNSGPGSSPATGTRTSSTVSPEPSVSPRRWAVTTWRLPSSGTRCIRSSAQSHTARSTPRWWRLSIQPTPTVYREETAQGSAGRLGIQLWHF